MWARHMEIALALWLAVSPWVFRHDPEASWLWIHDLVLALGIGLASSLCHWRPLRRVYLANFLFGTWLVAAGWWLTSWSEGMAMPAAQNWMVLGLLLLMFAIVPGEASRPPARWRDAVASRSGGLAPREER